MAFVSDVILHARRLFRWRLNQIVPTSNERKKLEAGMVVVRVPNGNGDDPDPNSDGADDNAGVSLLGGYLAWRHTNLLVACPITLFSAIWDLIRLVQDMNPTNTQYFNGFGKFILSIPYVASLVLFGTVLACTWWWVNWRRTRFLLKTGWAISFVLPFLPSIFPIEVLLNGEALQIFHQNESTMVYLYELKSVLALQYVFVILPLILTFPGGAVRAAIRIRGLLPESALSTWILVLSAPFYSLLVLTSLVVMIQLVGNAVLIVGTVLLTINPWIYVAFRKWYLASFNMHRERRLDHLQKVTGFLNVLGFVLILVWALTSGAIGQMIPYETAVRFVFVGFGNGLITSIVFCDAFLRMTITHWKRETDYRRRHNGGKKLDGLFSLLEGSIRKPSYNNSGSATNTSYISTNHGSTPPNNNSKTIADGSESATTESISISVIHTYSSPTFAPDKPSPVVEDIADRNDDRAEVQAPIQDMDGPKQEDCDTIDV